MLSFYLLCFYQHNIAGWQNLATTEPERANWRNPVAPSSFIVHRDATCPTLAQYTDVSADSNSDNAC